MILVELSILALSIYCLVATFYYFLSAFIFILRHKSHSISSTQWDQIRKPKRFLILIPAHNEESVLPRLLKSILAIEYPSSFFSSCVICDNCHDATERIANEFGSIVVVRRNTEKQGKGYAIQFALNSLDIDRFDVILMTDADTILEKNILRELTSLFIDDNIEAVQCYNGVINPDETPLTRLISLSRALEIIYMDSRDFLGLTVHLIGNGMCFRPSTLKKCPWSAFSISEDLEYFCILTANRIKVHYSFLSRVLLQEERTLSHAKNQRQRWASGKFQLILKYVPKLLWNGFMKGNMGQAEAVMILLVPNPSLLANMLVFIISFNLLFISCPFANHLSIISFLLLSFYFLSSFLLVKPDIRTLFSLFIIPIYLVWKGLIDISAILGRKRHQWLKTKRH